MDQLLEYIRYFAFTFFGGILGYLIKTQMEHRLALSRTVTSIEITSHNKSVAYFRAAFAPTLAYLYLAKKHGKFDESPAPNVATFLRNALINHATAIELFRVVVPENNRTAYQETWEAYRSEVAFGFDTNNLRQDIDDPYAIYENLIHKMLSFAKAK